MRRILLGCLLVGWLAVLILGWLRIPLRPRYEIPLTQSWTHLSDDGETLLVGNVFTTDEAAKQVREEDLDLDQYIALALNEPPPGSKVEMSVYDSWSGRVKRKFEIAGGLYDASADGSLLAVNDFTGALQLWDTRTGSLVATLACLPGHSVATPTLAINRDGSRVAYATPHPAQKEHDSPAIVCTWNLNSEVENLTLLDARPPLALSADNKLLATANDDRAVQIRNAADGKIIATFSSFTFPVSAIAFAPDSMKLAVIANNPGRGDDRRPSEMRLYDVARSTELATTDLPADVDIHHLSFDGREKCFGATRFCSRITCGGIWSRRRPSYFRWPGTKER